MHIRSCLVIFSSDSVSQRRSSRSGNLTHSQRNLVQTQRVFSHQKLKDDIHIDLFAVSETLFGSDSGFGE